MCLFADQALNWSQQTSQHHDELGFTEPGSIRMEVWSENKKTRKIMDTHVGWHVSIWNKFNEWHAWIWNNNDVDQNPVSPPSKSQDALNPEHFNKFLQPKPVCSHTIKKSVDQVCPPIIETNMFLWKPIQPFLVLERLHQRISTVDLCSLLNPRMRNFRKEMLVVNIFHWALWALSTVTGKLLKQIALPCLKQQQQL